MDIKEIDEMFKYKNEYDIPKHLLKRGGSGIIGSTIEYVLGIKENSKPFSDLDNLEIKTKIPTSKALTTLFSKGTRAKTKSNPYPNWFIPKDFLKNMYGTGYIDISYKENSKNLKLDFDNEEKISIINTKTKDVYYTIDIEVIDNILKNKLKNLLFIEAEKISNIVRINKAIYYGGVSIDSFIELIECNKIFIEVRNGRSGHDHGTAFRINKDNIYKLYSNKKEYIWN